MTTRDVDKIVTALGLMTGRLSRQLFIATWTVVVAIAVAVIIARW